MTDTSESTGSSKHFWASGTVHITAIATWSLIQLLVLTLSAARVPLWARAPQPGESLAVHQMLIAQVIAGSLLFPWLMRSAALSICVILISIPFVQLSAVLSQTEWTQAGAGWLYVFGWLMALGLWSSVLQTRATQLLGVAGAVSLVVGGPVVRYVSTEFHHVAPSQRELAWILDPTTGAYAQLQSPTEHALAWLVPSVVLVAGLVCRVLLRCRSDSTSYPQG